MNRFIEIKKLEKTYFGRGLLKRKKNAVSAVDRVSFGIEKNSVFGLVGESGCGKTSLVRALLYLDPPSAGEVWIDDTLLGSLSKAELRSFRKRMQIVFQDPNAALNPKMTIEDSLDEGLVNRGFNAAERKKRIIEILTQVGISPTHRKRYPHEFSGGQKQRIVIARALSMEPDFLVLDEPVSNLDVSIQAQIINLLQDLKDALILTYLFISHDLNLVAYLSDQIAVMYRGRIVEVGSTDEIMASPRHPYTLKLFSSIPGTEIDTGLERFNTPEESHDKSDNTGKKNVSPMTGCHYVDTCPIQGNICKSQAPPLKTVQGTHAVACFKIDSREQNTSENET
jgi:oligopeptide/dipeptide ABC transporter ATP-binding protein